MTFRNVSAPRVFIAILLALTIPLFAQTGGQPVASLCDGTVTVIKDGAQSAGSENLNTPLAVGTIITTGDDGYITIQIAPGITIQLQPNTQITIGEAVPGKGVNEQGDSIPEVSIRLAVGSVVVTSTAEGLAGTSFLIETARGIAKPVNPGNMIVVSTGADPATATVTVASPVGDDLVTTTEGEQLPVAEGLVVILRPDGIEYAGIEDYPNLPGANAPPPVSLPPVAPPPPDPIPTPTPPPLSP